MEQHGSPHEAPPVIVITGPTASGKGSVAFALAKSIGGEIVSLDSMKLYREMDVGTAKPSAARRAEVRYHLIDLVTPDKSFSTGEYLPLFYSALDDIASRGRRPIVCGGTALYLMGILRGFGSTPPADWTIRDRLIDEASRLGPEALHARLAALDPDAARRILEKDTRRIVRALEVHELTGRPQSGSWSWKLTEPELRFRLYGLAWERKELYARADSRVRKMVESGLFAEAERLASREPPIGRTASQSIGYKEILDGTARGESREVIVEAIQRNTRRLVKRQLTWFRKMPVDWIEVGGEIAADAIALEIARRAGPAAGGSQSS